MVRSQFDHYIGPNSRLKAPAEFYSATLFDSVIESIPDMVFIKDAESLRYVALNKATEDFIGRSREEIIDSSDYDFFPIEQADFFAKQDRQIVNGRSSLNIIEEFVMVPVRGLRTLQVKKIPLIDEDEVVRYVLCISSDVTEKHKAVNRGTLDKVTQHLAFLADASAILSNSFDYRANLALLAKLIVDQCADACMIDLVESSGSIECVALNHRDEKLLLSMKRMREEGSFDFSHFIGKTEKFRVGHGQGFDVTAEVLQKITRSSHQKDLLLELGLKQAMVVPLSTRGRVFGAITCFSSHLDSHFTNLELSIAEDLARRVSFAVENAQLYEKAQQANKAKSIFLANMSHEIRTPLSAMLGFADLLAEKTQKEAESIEYLNTIVRNGRQLLHIVNEILDLSKIESDCMSIEEIQFCLDDTLSEVVSLLNLQAQEKGIYLHVEKCKKTFPKWIVSDPTRLRQILINVVGNAIKFTEKGEVKIKVCARPSEIDPSLMKVEFYIQDTGIGITPEQEKKLFQPFQQAEQSTSRKFGGTGLGLFLSKKMAHTLKGDLILFKCQASVGCTFLLTIEVECPQHEQRTSSFQYSQSGRDPAVNAAHIKVLVVDDSVDSRNLIARMVRNTGAHVETAENGAIAVHKALNSAFDLVLMDVQMPTLDGFEATRKLREQSYDKPIVAITAHAMKGDRERCLRSGFDEHIAKPIDKTMLLNVFRKFIVAH